MSGATRTSKAAFTLVELLVAMTVLTVLTVMVAQLMSGATSAITNSRKRLDADAEARLIFDRMEQDFIKMLHRSDIDYLFKTQPGNDYAFFYSEASGYFAGGGSSSTVSLVGYRINANSSFYPNTPVLERLGKGLAWDGGVGKSAGVSAPGSTVHLTYPSGASKVTATPTPLPSSTLLGNWPNVANATSADDDFSVIGEQVFRLEFCFLLTNGAVSKTPWIAPHNAINGFQDVSAIVIAIGILDSASQKIVIDRQKLAAALPDPTDADLQAPSPRLMAQTWNEAINNPTFASTAGIPTAAASQVRAYQRYFYLNR